MNREQHMQHGQSFEHLAGKPVYTSDNQQLGTVDSIVNPSGQSKERYVVVNPATAQVGRDQLFVPESEIQTIGQDRVILELPIGAVSNQNWTSPPSGTRR